MSDPINYLVTDVQLKAIADKIRSKTGVTTALEFYDGFLSEIEKLTDTRDADAVAGDIRTGKTAYVNKQKVTGNVPTRIWSDVSRTNNTVHIPSGIYDYNVNHVVGTYTRDTQTINTSTSDQEIPADTYCKGAQTIKAVTTSNIDAANIKKGVNVKVGDANSAGRIKDVTGTYTGSERVFRSIMYSDVKFPQAVALNAYQSTTIELNVSSLCSNAIGIDEFDWYPFNMEFKYLELVKSGIYISKMNIRIYNPFNSSVALPISSNLFNSIIFTTFTT